MNTPFDNPPPAHMSAWWRDQFSVRSQRTPPSSPAANWLKDFVEYPMVQTNIRQVGEGLRDGPCATWWTVEAYGRDLVRTIPTGETSVGFGDAMGAGYLSTAIQLRISQNADRPIFVDVGTGVRISLLTDQINVSLFVPCREVAFAQTTQPDPVQASEGSTVIDSTTTVIVTCSQNGGPIGNRISTLTRTYDRGDTDVPGPLADTLGARLRGGNQEVIAGDYLIPPRARTVQFSTPEPPPAGEPIDFFDRPTDRNTLASYRWDGASAISPRIEIPRNCSILNMAGVSAGPVTAFYELEL